MDNQKYFEGKITYIGEPKEVAKNLWSVGLKVKGDDTFHNVCEFDLEKVKAIIGTAKIGDNVSLREDRVKGYWNVKSIKFIEVVEAELNGIKPIDSYEIPDDLNESLGNIYAMSEEKLNALIEQGANTQVKLDNVIDLVMKLCKNANIELDSFKKASEV